MPHSENRPPLVIRHVDVGALVRAVEQPDFPRPLGATPLSPPLTLIPDESEPADMGDALALDRAILEAAPQSYAYRWYWSLGSSEAA